MRRQARQARIQASKAVDLVRPPVVDTEEDELDWARPLEGPFPLAGEEPLAVPIPPARRLLDPESLTAVEGLASELTELLIAELGPGCAATPGLTFDRTGYDTRLLSFDVPVAYADRLIDAFRVTRAARRLVTLLDSARDLPKVHVGITCAYQDLRRAVRGRAGAVRARAALGRTPKTGTG